MSKKLTGKVALVTGGSRGIGAAIARRRLQRLVGFDNTLSVSAHLSASGYATAHL